MLKLHRTVRALLFLALVSMPLSGITQEVAAAPASCATSSPSPATYRATICITSPADGSTLTEFAIIKATVTVVGKNPDVQHVAFYLNGAPLLEDFSSPYEFVLPTRRWVDGKYKLSAEALMRDQFTTARANISLTFHTGTTTPPVNTQQFRPAAGTTPALGQPFIVAVVGDGAGGDPAEGQITNLIASWKPNLFLYLGDIYERGTVAEILNWYASTKFFGRFRAITDPTVGNHEYNTGNDSAYRYYWDNIPDYYSFNADGWHFISLDSNVKYVAVDSASAEYKWLAGDLARNTAMCTAVFFHHPYLSIGKEGSHPLLIDIWQLLAKYHVTLVLNGHDHEYQRWVPLDGSAQPNPSGMTEFIVGTGGHSLTPFLRTDSRVAFSIQKTFGALRLQLNSTFADFTYFGAGGRVIDSGTVSCKG